MAGNVQVAKWRNRLVVQLPAALVKMGKIEEGDTVSVELVGERSVAVRPKRRKYSVKDLVTGMTEKNRSPETKWGRPVGKESW